MRFLAALALLPVAACTPTLGQSSPAGGIIKLGGVVQGRGKAMDLATAECAKHGRDARVTGIDELSNTATYECVAR